MSQVSGTAGTTFKPLLTTTLQQLRDNLNRFRSTEGYQPLEVLQLPDSDGDLDDYDDDLTQTQARRREATTGLVERFLALLGVGWTIGIFYTYPFPSTIPIFIGGLIYLVPWTVYKLYKVAYAIWWNNILPTTWSLAWRIRLGISTLLLLYLATHGVLPPRETMPILRRTDPMVPERYFIGANLYNNEAVFSTWSKELLRLVEFLGEENVFISIVESNSKDNTQHLLAGFGNQLILRGIDHRISTGSDGTLRWWPYNRSPERIEYLSKVRNRVLLPLQSENTTLRLEDYDTFTKVIFLNDIFYTAESIIRLLGTRLDGDETISPDYDLACAMDYGWSGLFDTWVARDVCGTPMRAFWPYVKDKESISRVKKELPFEVAACWNGAVVFPAGPYLWRTSENSTDLQKQKRGWKMVDDFTYPGSRMSPTLELPIKFRASHIDACDHSECFLFSYDLHRLYNTPERKPRILMNPRVKVAYEENWWRWNTVVLRIPVVDWELESGSTTQASGLDLGMAWSEKGVLYLGGVQSAGKMP